MALKVGRTLAARLVLLSPSPPNSDDVPTSDNHLPGIRSGVWTPTQGTDQRGALTPTPLRGVPRIIRFSLARICLAGHARKMESEPCRKDHGRALVAVAHKIGTEEAFIEFSDGKRYKIAPFWEADYWTMVEPNASPGCWFNKVIRRRRRYGFQRVSMWPKLPQIGWLGASWTKGSPLMPAQVGFPS